MTNTGVLSCARKFLLKGIVASALLCVAMVCPKSADAKVCFLPSGDCMEGAVFPEGEAKVKEVETCKGFNLTKKPCTGEKETCGWICSECTNKAGTHYKCEERPVEPGCTRKLTKCDEACSVYESCGKVGNYDSGKCKPMEGYVSAKPGHCYTYTTTKDSNGKTCYKDVTKMEGYAASVTTGCYNCSKAKGSDGTMCYKCTAMNDYQQKNPGNCKKWEEAVGENNTVTCYKITDQMVGYSTSKTPGCYNCEQDSGTNKVACYTCSAMENYAKVTATKPGGCKSYTTATGADGTLCYLTTSVADVGEGNYTTKEPKGCLTWTESIGSGGDKCYFGISDLYDKDYSSKCQTKKPTGCKIWQQMTNTAGVTYYYDIQNMGAGATTTKPTGCVKYKSGYNTDKTAYCYYDKSVMEGYTSDKPGECKTFTKEVSDNGITCYKDVKWIGNNSKATRTKPEGCRTWKSAKDSHGVECYYDVGKVYGSDCVDTKPKGCKKYDTMETPDHKTYYYNISNMEGFSAEKPGDCRDFVTDTAGDGTVCYKVTGGIGGDANATSTKPKGCKTWSSSPDKNDSSKTCYYNIQDMSGCQEGTPSYAGCKTWTRQSNTDNSASCYCNISAELTKPETEEKGEEIAACTVEQSCSAQCASKDAPLIKVCGCGGTQSRSGYKKGKQSQSGLKTRTKTRTRAATCDANGGGWQIGEYGDWVFSEWGNCSGSGAWTECSDFGSCIWNENQKDDGWGACDKGDCTDKQQCVSGTCQNCEDIYKESDLWFVYEPPKACYVKDKKGKNKQMEVVSCGKYFYRKYALMDTTCDSGFRFDETLCRCAKVKCSDGGYLDKCADTCSGGVQTSCTKVDYQGLTCYEKTAKTITTCEDMGYLDPAKLGLNMETMSKCGSDTGVVSYSVPGKDICGLKCVKKDSIAWSASCAGGGKCVDGTCVCPEGKVNFNNHWDSGIFIPGACRWDCTKNLTCEDVGYLDPVKLGLNMETMSKCGSDTGVVSYSVYSFSDDICGLKCVKKDPIAWSASCDGGGKCVDGKCVCPEGSYNYNEHWSGSLYTPGACRDCAEKYKESDLWFRNEPNKVSGCYVKDKDVEPVVCGNVTYTKYAPMDTTCDSGYRFDEAECKCVKITCSDGGYVDECKSTCSGGVQTSCTEVDYYGLTCYEKEEKQITCEDLGYKDPSTISGFNFETWTSCIDSNRRIRTYKKHTSCNLDCIAKNGKKGEYWDLTVSCHHGGYPGGRCRNGLCLCPPGTVANRIGDTGSVAGTPLGMGGCTNKFKSTMEECKAAYGSCKKVQECTSITPVDDTKYYGDPPFCTGDVLYLHN